MRIVFLSRGQKTTNRGAENFVFELFQKLSKDHQVDIFSGKDADDLPKIINGKYQVVIPINGRLQSLKVSLGRAMGGYKMLITGHSGIGRDDIWNITVCRPDVFVALTGTMAKWAKNWSWGSQIVKIPNGIDLKKFSTDGEKTTIDLPRPIILCVGALTWYKHQEKLIEAVARLNTGSLLIIGEGKRKWELEKLGHQLLGNRFRLTSINYQDMPVIYRSCDLFSLPSWNREAFGLVYLEALASGLGVVAPNDESRQEIIGQAGILVNVDNTTLYAEAISKALKSDWSKKAKAQAEKFSWEFVANEYEKVLLNITGIK